MGSTMGERRNSSAWSLAQIPPCGFLANSVPVHCQTLPVLASRRSHILRPPLNLLSPAKLTSLPSALRPTRSLSALLAGI